MNTPPNAPVAADSGLQKAVEHLRALLIEGETLEAWAAQRRIFALTHRRIVIAATSGRFLGLKRGLLGGFDLTDLRWQDLKDASIRVGIFGADVSLTASGMTDLALASAVTVKGSRETVSANEPGCAAGWAMTKAVTAAAAKWRSKRGRVATFMCEEVKGTGYYC